MFRLHIAHDSGCAGIGAEHRGVNLDIVEGLGMNLLKLYPGLARFAVSPCFLASLQFLQGAIYPDENH